MKKILLVTATVIIVFVTVLFALDKPEPVLFTNSRNLVEGDELMVNFSDVLLNSEQSTENLSQYIVSRDEDYVTYILAVGDYSLLKKRLKGNEYVYRIVYIHVK